MAPGEDSIRERIRYFFYELTLPKEIRQIDKIHHRLLKVEGCISNTIIDEKYPYIFEGIMDYHQKLLKIRYSLFCKWEIEKENKKLEKEKIPEQQVYKSVEDFQVSWIQGLKYDIEDYICYTLIPEFFASRAIKKFLIKAIRRI